MNQKGLAAGIVVLFIVASSFIGLSNKTEHVTVGTNKLDTPNKMSTYNCPIDSAWLTYSHDNRHTGQSPYSTRDNPMDVKWKFEAQFLGFESSPVIDKNGVLYILARDSNLYALNPDGSERWQYNINEWGSFSAAIAEDGTVYVGSHDGYLFAINSDGSLKWRFPTGDSIWGSPTIGNDGTIYFGVLRTLGWDIGRVYAVNPDGSEKWHTDVADYIYTTPALAEDGTVYITSNDNYLYALHPENGSILWEFHTGEEMGCPCVGVDGTIYGASLDNYLYALYPNGTEKWRTEIDYGSYCTPAIGNDGTIYIGGKYFYAVNPDGSMKWIYHGWESNEYQCTSSAYAISADGIIYFVATKDNGHGGDLFALNCDNGSLFWRKNIAPIDDQFASPVIGNDGTIYVGSEFFGDSTDGYLYAFGAVDNNHPPEKPDINGPSTGKTLEEQTYQFTTTDQDSDDVYVFVDWGDGSNSSWIGPNLSGEQIILTHTWNLRGTYTIKSKAMDEHEVEGEWRNLSVILPYSHTNLLSQFFELLFQQFPNAFPLLRCLMGY